MAQVDLRGATIRISDGSTNHIDVKIGEGDLNYEEKRQIDYVKSRGELDTVRENEEEPVDVSLTFVWENITSATGEPISVEDALKRRNGASAWVSALSDSDAPYCVNISVTTIPNCPGVKAEVILLPQFNRTNLAHSLRDATVALKGTCNVTEATATRVTI